MSDPAAFFALLALLVSLGSIGYTSRLIGRLADQYSEFVQTHINGLRIELSKKHKDQTKSVEIMLREFEAMEKAAKSTQEELLELRLIFAELKARVGYAEEEMNARMPPRRVAKNPTLRAFP